MKKLDELERHVLFEKNLPKEVILFVLERDNWMCRSCNDNYGVQPHHINYRSKTWDHRPENIVTLCFNCHRAIHNGQLILKVVNGEYFFGGKKRF